MISDSLIGVWNSLLRRNIRFGLKVGFEVRDGSRLKRQIAIPDHLRAEHVAVLGKTGTGKSSLLRYFMSQDVTARRGFLCIDLHGDLLPFVLSKVEEFQSKESEDLSGKLLVIDPASPKYATGMNLLECDEKSRPVQISEMVSLLQKRWSLDHFGARTEELLRNSLWVLSENDLTLVEMAPLLTVPAYRAQLLKRTRNAEVRRFFEDRYDLASHAMQTVMREAVLNKVTTFTVDPAIRHIVGQSKSSISLKAAVDQGMWVCLNLRKGTLGDNAWTLAGLFLTKFKNAIFSRSNQNLFTIYADELPNLVAVDESFITLLSEARKFSVSVVSANQFLGQFTPAVRSALLSVGTSLCFELSSEDAPTMARALGGGSSLARRLATLEHREIIGKVGQRTYEAIVPQINKPSVRISNLAERSLQKFGRLRESIEFDINARSPKAKTATDLSDWD
jgi:hypothetical protein